MVITWNTDVNAPCLGEILGGGGRSILIQTDWDCPGTASTFGWDISSVQGAEREGDFDYFAECGVWKCTECGHASYPMEVVHDEDIPNDQVDRCPECLGIMEQFTPCRHQGTDGTVDCKECGIKAGTFIAAAMDWLADNDGAQVEDPGYFLED